MPLQVSVTGGKGGTGKSFIATNLAWLASKRTSVVLADLDVEAPNDHLLLGVERLEGEEPIRIFFPAIDYSKCTSCGACAKVCDTGAIIMAGGKPPFVIPRLCSGCKACLLVCPYDAILEARRVIGYTYDTRVTGSLRLVTGILREGEEHTPPAIVEAKRRAMNVGAGLHIVDTGAGTGNGISIALRGSRLVLAVTEPTPLGLHDLESILRVSTGMGLETWVVINKHGIGDESRHQRLAREYGVERVYKVPAGREAVEAYVRGTPVVEAYPESRISRAIRGLAEHVFSSVGV